MTIFDLLTRPHDLAANRHAKRPGDVWCLSADGERHAVDYLCRCDFFVTVAPTPAICGATLQVGGHARPGRPTCSACLAELVRAAPLLAARLEWRGRVSTCGRWRVRRQKQPEIEGYPWVVLELYGRTWGLADSVWCPDEEGARSFAQELETKRVCEALRRERREPAAPAKRSPPFPPPKHMRPVGRRKGERG